MRLYLYAIYFSLGPIYWLPQVSITSLEVFKLCIFFLITLDITINWIKSGACLKNNIYIGLLALSIVGLLISFLAHSTENFSASAVTNLLLPLFILSTGAGTDAEKNHTLINAIKVAPLLFSFFAILIPLGLLIPSLNYQNPFYDESTWQFSQTYTGFGGSRTGWSLGASFLAAAALANAITANGWHKFINLMAFTTIVTSVAIPGGRGGLLAIAAILATASILNGSLKRRKIATFVPAIMLILLIGLGYVFSEELRLSLLLSGDVSAASTGRTDGYMIGIALLMNDPVFGSGLQAADLINYGLQYSEIHNAILNYSVKFGLISSMPIILLFALLYMLIMTSKLQSLQQWEGLVFTLSLISLSVLTLLEPTTAFGNFHSTMIFWFITVIYLNRNPRMSLAHTQRKS